MLSFLEEFWPEIVGILTTLLAILASANAVLYKRDSRAAIGWVGLIWLVPILGPILYALLGVNRIQRRATVLRQNSSSPQTADNIIHCDRDKMLNTLPVANRRFVALADLVHKVTNSPLTAGNTITPLVNGDKAYPAMLMAIDAARTTIALSTYIFDNDTAGHRFADALARAVDRGVAVRVLLDGVGARYSLPPIAPLLRKHRIPVAHYLSSLWPWRMPYLNLRTHRKILVVDGCIGFTGGMNICLGNMLEWAPKHPIQDIHFRLQGPVVAQTMAVFAEDWAFSTREELTGETWFPPLQAAGAVLARAIAAGPDADLDKLRWTILGALNQAHSSVRIVTPYFLPDQVLITAIMLAAMRGVQVDIVLPEVNNLPYVQWASTAQLWQFLRYGCRITLSRPPFDHSKLMLVDGIWAFMGTANWDPRSLRLNFEINIECYDEALVELLNRLVDKKIEQGKPLTLEEVNARNLPIKLRDGVARLFSPYL